MPRHWVQLDPAGYKWTQEPGSDVRMKGDDLMRAFGPARETTYRLHHFYNPPGSEWIMPGPKQFRPYWGGSVELANHVIRRAQWSFPTGVVTYESEFTKKPGATSFPANQFITVVTPTSFTSLDSRNYTNLGTAAGVTFPAGTGTVARASVAPLGCGLDDYDLSPHWHFFTYPEPDDWFLCGFSNLAFYFYKGFVHILRTPDGGTTWELLKMYEQGARGLSLSGHNPYVPFGPGALAQPRVLEHQVYIIPFSPWHIEIVYNQSSTVVPLKSYAEVPPGSAALPLFPGPGDWWIAASPRQKFHLQTQVMGYEEATTNAIALRYPTQPVFDLSAQYSAGGGPTVAPVLDWLFYAYLAPGASYTTGTDADGAAYAESPTTGERFTFDLTKTDYTHWVSGPTQYRGGIRLKLRPSTEPQCAGYLAPKLNYVQWSFAEVLANRTNDLLQLSDLEFAGWEIESSYDNPLGKRAGLFLTANGLHTLMDTAHAGRDYYPMHFLEDTDENGVPETLRGATWVHSSSWRQEVAWLPGYLDTLPLRVFRFEGAGLLSRGNKHSLYLPVILPAPGQAALLHTDAARRTLKQIGFDVTDSSRVYIHTDPAVTAGGGAEVAAQLPGSGPSASGPAGQKIDPAWVMDWDESRTGYVHRLATEFRGWVLYEDLAGKVWYVPDLMLDLQLGEKYKKSAVIYRSGDEAAAAGAPGQFMLTEPQPEWETIEPQCNVVRVTGGENDNPDAEHVIDRKPQAYGAVHSYEHFTGEPISKTIRPRIATVSLAAKKQAARVYLLRNHRRKRRFKFSVPLAPWQFIGSAPVDVGYVVEVLGHGVFLIIGARLCLLWSLPGTGTVYRLHLVGELLPFGAVEGTGTGTMDYPGHWKPGV